MDIAAFITLLKKNRGLNIFGVVDLGDSGEMLAPISHEEMLLKAEEMQTNDPDFEIPCNHMSPFLYVGEGA